jgi:predicted small lipoprotein YifL
MKMKAGVFAALAVLLLLAACGKKGPPQPPGPADQVIYPRSYPAY